MSRQGEKTLIQHLAFEPSLRWLATSAFSVEMLPTEDLRPVYEWAMDYYFASDRTKAPSPMAFGVEWANVLSDNEIDMEVEPEDSVEWATEDLIGDYVRVQFEEFNRASARAMAESNTSERIGVLAEASGNLTTLLVRLTDRRSAVEGNEGLLTRGAAYAERMANPSEMVGMGLGIPEVDSYLMGIHPGELMVLGGLSKSGKSAFASWVGLSEWRRGRRPIIYTLELSVETFYDRIICQGAGIDSDRWQRGECTPPEIERFMAFREEAQSYEGELMVVSPEMGRRSVEHLVREARAREADGVIIDQLTFVELPNSRRPKTERIGEALHWLHVMIGEGTRLPCLLVHQMKREARETTRKTGRFAPDDFADSVEVERTVDHAMAIYQSRDDMIAGRAKLQMLADRRKLPKDWELIWNIHMGQVRFVRDLDSVTVAA
jgi:replicative DNA helicase